MRVIVGCEFSQVVTKAFRAKGIEACSCDLLPTEGNPDWHFQEDILELLKREKFDLGIFHPPCTHLAVSGARYFKEKQADGRQEAALEFVKKLMDAQIEKICIENPISIISTKIRKPSQIIQPCWFGDPHYKSTCLWLKNLPKLIPTNMVEPLFTTYKSTRKRVSRHHYDTFRLPKAQRGHIRSITFKGIADAMANQWNLISI